jgi:hypothetical protein
MLINVEWQLREIRGRFFRLPPKDDSYRSTNWEPLVPVDLPVFLAELLTTQVEKRTRQRCACVGGATPTPATPACWPPSAANEPASAANASNAGAAPGPFRAGDTFLTVLNSASSAGLRVPRAELTGLAGVRAGSTAGSTQVGGPRRPGTTLGRIHNTLKNTEGTPALTIRATTARGDIAARRLGAEPRGGLLDFLEDALEGVHLRLHVVQLGGYLA